MAQPSITQPAQISADVVLELGKYQSAQQLRKLQTKLTTTAREIQGLTTYGYSLLGRLNALQLAVQEARTSVLGATYEIETLSLWAAVLSDAQLRRAGK